MSHHKTIRARAWRRADTAKKRAYDSWLNLSPVEQREIVDFYEYAIILQERTGVKYVVDHIQPIRFGGTHTAENLQVITLEDNMLKGSTKPTEADYRNSLIQRYCLPATLTQDKRGRKHRK